MIVYGSSMSPFVRKVLVICAEKGLEVDNRVFGPGVAPTADFLEASPFGKIPALRDGGYTLADSSAIAHYLEALRPEPRLIPVEPQARGRAVWFDEFADTVVFATGVKTFFNRVVGPLIGAPYDVAVAERAEAEELPAQLDYMERETPETGWLVGDAFSLADVAVGAVFANFVLSGGRVCGRAHPRFRAYLERVHERPSFKPLIASNLALVERHAARLHRIAG